LTFQNARRAKARKRSVTVADVPMDCGSAPEKLVLHAKPEVFFYSIFILYLLNTLLIAREDSKKI
jgi:hypothetical protein